MGRSRYLRRPNRGGHPTLNPAHGRLFAPTEPTQETEAEQSRREWREWLRDRETFDWQDTPDFEDDH